jgi:hypothetical protein
MKFELNPQSLIRKFKIYSVAFGLSVTFALSFFPKTHNVFFPHSTAFANNTGVIRNAVFKQYVFDPEMCRIAGAVALENYGYATLSFRLRNGEYAFLNSITRQSRVEPPHFELFARDYLHDFLPGTQPGLNSIGVHNGIEALDRTNGTYPTDRPQIGFIVVACKE